MTLLDYCCQSPYPVVWISEVFGPFGYHEPFGCPDFEAKHDQMLGLEGEIADDEWIWGGLGLTGKDNPVTRIKAWPNEKLWKEMAYGE